MSMQLIITTTVGLDGATVVDLTTGFTVAGGIITYAFTTAIGLLDLQEIPGVGPVDVKIERLAVTSISDASADIVYPGGGAQTFMDEAATFPRNVSQWAVLFPLGTRLALDAAAPVFSTVTIHLRGYSNDEWFRLQSGHRFCPRTMQNHFNQSNPVS